MLLRDDTGHDQHGGATTLQAPCLDAGLLAPAGHRFSAARRQWREQLVAGPTRDRDLDEMLVRRKHAVVCTSFSSSAVEEC